MCSVTEARRIVFYRTLAIDPESRTGSGVPPAKLLEACRQLGYSVDVVAGPARERRRAAREVRQKVSTGTRYDFLYAEPPTTPIMLNEPHHLPTHPLLDYRLFGFCHSRGIPVVLFYCDVQWTVPDYRRRVGAPRVLGARPFFYLDLRAYSRLADILLVPEAGYLKRISRWISD